MSRIALALALALAIVVTLELSPAGVGHSSALAADTAGSAGVTYGGIRDGDMTWLRLNRARTAVRALEISWTARRKECSDGRLHAGLLWAGSYHYSRILVRDGHFKRTVRDSYPVDDGSRWRSAVTVTGKVTRSLVTGTIEGTLDIERPDDTTVHCEFGPGRWRAIN